MRAVFAEDDDQINPLHGADSKEAAEKEIQALFPPQSTVAVIKPDAYGEVEQRGNVFRWYVRPYGWILGPKILLTKFLFAVVTR